MPYTHDPYWEALTQAAHSGTIVLFRRAIQRLLDTLNFQALYFLAPIVADRRAARVLWNIGFPRELEQEYQQGLWQHDPLPDIALSRTRAFRFSDAPRLTKLTKGQQEFLKRAGEGVGVLCIGPYARSGFVGVGLQMERKPLMSADVRRTQVAAQLCFQRYCDLVGPNTDGMPELSQRELDVITWIGEGKSNAVIAEILGISKNSVDSYVKRIFAKLGVSDRTAAAVRAVSLGLIAAGKHSRQAAHRPRWLI
ncbi:MAG: hypothetical protein APF78_12060 [Sphingomonadales bacterium BRH_c3]|nr:MAG: hypothetical protein APF78_12060 [Sphingomonadales bacterium BRH_c3]